MTPEIIEPTHIRGRASQERIVRAILGLIETTPFDQLTIAAIMEEAGMAVGTFYRRFKTKESVLPFVFKAYDELFVDWAAGFAASEPTSRDEMIELVVRRTAALFSEHAGLIRTVHLYDRLHPGIRPATSSRPGLVHLMGAVLAKDFDQPTPDDLTKGSMAMLTMVSVLTEYSLYPAHSPANGASLDGLEVQTMLIEMLKALDS